jgi:hypothetical protein
MKGVAPPNVNLNVKLEEIIWAAVPYMIFDVLVITMIIVWPDIALCLQGFREGIDFRFIRFLRSFWLEKGLYMTAWRRSFTYLRVRTYGS